MNSTTATAACLVLLACLAGDPVFAQEKPAAALAVSSQGKDKTAVDISVALRHVAPADAKCADAACAAADHWLVEIEVAGRTPVGKPVTLAMTQGKEIEKELRTAAAPKAKKVGEATISDSTLSIRVPAGTRYALVQQLLATAATSGLHKIEFAVASAGAAATEKGLPVPFPVDQGAKLVETDAQAKVEEIRIAVMMDQRGQVRRVLGKNTLRDDDQLRGILQVMAADLARLGRKNRAVIIDAASGVPWQAIVVVIDIARSAGFENVQFATAKK